MLDLLTRPYLLYAAGAGLALALAGAGAQTVRLANEQAAHARTLASNAKTLQDIAELTTRASDAAIRARELQQQALSAADQKHTQELSHELAENNRLRAAVRAGQRLRIAATCPAHADRGDLPIAATAAGVDAQAAELTPEAGRAVWDIREALITERAQLLFLQDYVRNVCPAN